MKNSPELFVSSERRKRRKEKRRKKGYIYPLLLLLLSLLLLLLLLFTLRKNGVEIKFSLHSFIFAIPFPLQTFSIFPRLSFPCLVYLRWRFCLFTTELFAKLFESAPKFSPMFSRTAVSVSVYDQYSAAGTREEFVNDSTPSPEAAKKSRSTTVSVQGRGE